MQTNTLNTNSYCIILMARLEEMKGQELVDVHEEGNQIKLVFKNNRYAIKVEDGKFVFEQC